MKFRSIIALLMAFCCLLPLTSCKSESSGGGNSAVSSGEVKVKVLKGGRALCTVIRTKDATVVIDTSDVDHAADLTEFLAEKGIKEVDAVILTNYSKKCIGGMPDLLASGVTVKAVYGATYEKESNTHTLYANAMSSYNLTATKVAEETTLTFGDLSLTLYPALKNYATLEDENDNGNSMAVALAYGETSMLFTSRINGERVTELVGQLGGKTFDLITAPEFGIYDENLPALFSAVKAKYAAVVASNTNPPEDATIKALTDSGIKAVDICNTANGSIEISSDGKAVSMKQ